MTPQSHISAMDQLTLLAWPRKLRCLHNSDSRNTANTQNKRGKSIIAQNINICQESESFHYNIMRH